MQPITVLFYGRAGSGKGTQVQLLKDYFAKNSETKALGVETGAVFRQFVGGSSYTSKLAKEKLDKGELPEVFIPIWMWTGVLEKEFTGTEHLIFDGFPRRILEAKVLDSAFTFYGRRDVKVIVLNVSPEKTLERLKLRARGDDMNDDAIKARNAWYEGDVVPTIEYYRTHDAPYSVIDINGDQTPEAVFVEVKKALGLDATK